MLKEKLAIKNLLETVKLERTAKFNSVNLYDLDEHCVRMFNSIKDLGWALPKDINSYSEFYSLVQNKVHSVIKEILGIEKIKSLKTPITEAFLKGRYEPSFEVFKLRIIYSSEQTKRVFMFFNSAKDPVDIEIEAYQMPTKAFMVKVLDTYEYQVDSKDPTLKHKFYPRLDFLHFIKDCNEVIWTNDQGYICEGSFTNIFFIDKKGKWHTPALKNNLLPGVMRQKLIKKLNAQEGNYKLEDLQNAEQIKLSNSMLGFVDATIS